MDDMGFYWKKKTIVSFILSVFVFWIHIASFDQYEILLSSHEVYSNTWRMMKYTDSFITDSFVRVAVPLFFILSGANFFRNYQNKQYFAKLQKRVYSLLIPYLIWNTLGMIFEIVTSYSFISSYFVSRDIFVISFDSVLNSIFFYKCNGPFWFISTLMIFVILSPVFDFLLKRKIIAFASLLVFIILSKYEMDFLKPFIYKSFSFAYYMAGCIIGKYYMRYFSVKTNKIVSGVALFIFIDCTIIWLLRSIGVLNITTPISTIFLIFFALSFWVSLDLFMKNNDKIPHIYLYDSFFVYAMHINVSAIIVKLIYYALPKSSIWALPNFILSSFLTIFLILIIAALLRKHFPVLYSFLSGGKTYRTIKSI